VTDELRIAPIAESELGALLPLIAAYQRFYDVEEIEEERNRAFEEGSIAFLPRHHVSAARGYSTA
jgi:hypothetical protein